MKKSRTIVIIIMVLAIVTCLSAGTLAIYSTKLDNVPEVQIAAKRFVLTSATKQEQDVNIQLAPGDVRGINQGEDVYFTVCNYEGDTVAEVPIKVDMALISSGDIFKVSGLDIKIVDSDNPLADERGSNKGRPSWLYGYQATRSGLKMVYEPTAEKNNEIILPANTRTERTFRIRYQWLDDDQTSHNKEHTNAGVNALTGSLKLAVVGSQYIPAAASVE